MTPDGRLRVIVVCAGNICRSPMGEAVLRDRIVAAGLDDTIVVESAGTGGWHVGEPADPRGRATLKRRGYVLDHRARRFERSWFHDADLVLAMDGDNRDALLRLAPDPDAVARVRMMRSYDPLLADLPEDDAALDVPDPYYGGPEGFDTVLDMLEAAAGGVVDHLASMADPRQPRPGVPGEPARGREPRGDR